MLQNRSSVKIGFSCEFWWKVIRHVLFVQAKPRFMRVVFDIRSQELTFAVLYRYDLLASREKKFSKNLYHRKSLGHKPD